MDPRDQAIIEQEQNFKEMVLRCASCAGTGGHGADECAICEGKGTIPVFAPEGSDR